MDEYPRFIKHDRWQDCYIRLDYARELLAIGVASTFMLGFIVGAMVASLVYQ